MSTEFHNVRNVSMWEAFKEMFGPKKKGPRHPRPDTPPPQRLVNADETYVHYPPPFHLLIDPTSEYAREAAHFLETVLNEQPLSPKQMFLVRLTKDFSFSKEHNCYYNSIQLTGECEGCGFNLSSGKGIAGHWGCPKCHR